MSKMKELSQTLDDLIRVGEELVQTAQEIKKYFSEPDTDTAPTAKAAEMADQNPMKDKADKNTDDTKSEPKSSAEKQEKAAEKKKIELPEVRKLLAEKSRAGHTAEVKALLNKYGAAKLSALDPDKYEAVMKEAEVLGNG